MDNNVAIGFIMPGGSEHRKALREMKKKGKLSKTFDVGEHQHIMDMGSQHTPGEKHQHNSFHEHPRKSAMKHYGGKKVDGIPGRRNKKKYDYWKDMSPKDEYRANTKHRDMDGDITFGRTRNHIDHHTCAQSDDWVRYLGRSTKRDVKKILKRK